MARNKLEWCFFFLIFEFFLGILWPGSGRNGIRNKIFFHFLGLSQPDFSRNTTRMMCFDFLNFFAFFFGNSLDRVEQEWIWNQNFFLIFSTYLSSVWLEIKLERCFLFFWEFFNQGRVGTEFRTKIFVFSFSAYLSLISLEIKWEWRFLIFLISLLYFLGMV